jgi:uncharacterized membrane protein YfcA
MFHSALLILAVVSSATAAVIGFGIGSLLTPFLLLRLEPAMAVAVVALPHLLATVIRFVQHRQSLDRNVILRFGLPSAAGGFSGAWLQGVFDETWLFVILGGLLVATAVANVTRGFGGWVPGTTVALVLGFLSGLFGGLVGNQGGLRAAGLLAFNLAPRPYLATGTAVALLIDAARTPVYLARAGGELFRHGDLLWTAAAGCVLGSLFGEKLFFGIPADRYRTLVSIAVGVLGLWLLTR